jgi:hypothetical protein
MVLNMISTDIGLEEDEETEALEILRVDVPDRRGVAIPSCFWNGSPPSPWTPLS